MRHFYSHIVKIETVIVELDAMDLTESQKRHLAELVDSTVHHMVLDIVLSKLEHEDKMTFLAKLKKNPEDETIMGYLLEKIETIEEEIDQVVSGLKEELMGDIREAKRRRLNI